MTKPSKSKIHYARISVSYTYRELCGTPGSYTQMLDKVTCRRCMFLYLADQASWARAFLDDLRRPAGAPSRTAEPPHGKIKGASGPTSDALREQSVP